LTYSVDRNGRRVEQPGTPAGQPLLTAAQDAPEIRDDLTLEQISAESRRRPAEYPWPGGSCQPI
jgi:hypothetical protein